MKFARGDSFSTGHKEQKQFGTVCAVVIIKQVVHIVGKLLQSHYSTIDNKTEMYKVTETEDLALFQASIAKKEQFIEICKELTVVNFFYR